MLGLIIINGYTTYKSSIHQAERLKKELELLNVVVDIKRSTEIVSCFNGGDFQLDLPNYDFIIYLDKDRYLADILERHGYRLFNNAKSIEVCDDKMITHLELSNKSIPMPRTIGAPLCYSQSVDYSYLDKVVNILDLPVVVKESYGSKGAQVYLAKTKEELIEIEKLVRYKAHLFQEFIFPGGQDYRLIVINHKVVATMERKNDTDFRSNIAVGGIGKTVTLPESFIKVAEDASKILNLDYCGVDLLKDKNGNPLLCEVNSNAFFEEIESVTGVNVAKLYAEFIVSKVR